MKPNSKSAIHHSVFARLDDTIDLTLNHWRAANSLLPEEYPLVLFSKTTLEAAKSLHSAWKSEIQTATELQIDVDLEVEHLRDKQASLRRWIHFYNRSIRGLAPGTKWERLLFHVPQPRCAPEHLRDAAIAVRLYWTELEARPPGGWPGPVQRGDGSGLPEFIAEAEAYADMLIKVTEATVAASVAESFAAWTREHLAGIVLKYPAAVQCRFPADHPLLASAPKPWPRRKK